MWKTFFNDIGVAFCLLTRIPLQPPEIAFERSEQAVWAYGIVGIVWALVVWSTCIITSTLGLSNPVSALLGLAAGTILTVLCMKTDLPIVRMAFGAVSKKSVG